MCVVVVNVDVHGLPVYTALPLSITPYGPYNVPSEVGYSPPQSPSLPPPGLPPNHVPSIITQYGGAYSVSESGHITVLGHPTGISIHTLEYPAGGVSNAHSTVPTEHDRILVPAIEPEAPVAPFAPAGAVAQPAEVADEPLAPAGGVLIAIEANDAVGTVILYIDAVSARPAIGVYPTCVMLAVYPNG